MSENTRSAQRDVVVTNKAGLHTRPIMRIVDCAITFRSSIWVTNVSKGNERLDGKSAMDLMLLEATSGSTLRIEAEGEDAPEAVDAIAVLIGHQFDSNS